MSAKVISLKQQYPREYGVWRTMRARCTLPSQASYPVYGGRGIKVSERWLSFAAFIADMGPRPSDKHSIDRIDNDGNYEPGNCRWATPEEQSANKRNSVAVHFNGRRVTVRELSGISGVDSGTIRYRIRRGYVGDDIVSEDSRKVPPPYLARLKTGAPRKTHCKRGHSLDDAANVYLGKRRPDGVVPRHCRACWKARLLQRQEPDLRDLFEVRNLRS